ncbi:MAG: substrate-binding domain-containing protein, partial [Treponema sp.]|nr:substrate-binding domain-containing protein [Treponema sp.]
MAKVLKAFLVLTAVFMAFSSCKKQSAQADVSVSGDKKAESNFTIGFSIDTLAVERWRRDCDVFLNTAKDLGADVIVQNAGNSVQEQQKQIGYLISRGVKAIVVVPKQADSLTECIRIAKSKNIPVISYDRLTLNADI